MKSPCIITHGIKGGMENLNFERLTAESQPTVPLLLKVYVLGLEGFFSSASIHAGPPRLPYPSYQGDLCECSCVLYVYVHEWDS